MSDTPGVPAPAWKHPQFSVSALLWTTLAIALALAYLRQFASTGLFVGALPVIAAAGIVGVLVGWPCKRIADAAYWSVVITLAAYLSVIGDAAGAPMFRYAWSAVGMLTGAACGAVAAGRWLRRIVFGVVAGGTSMGVSAAIMLNGNTEWIFDLICAPVIGGLVAVLIEWILWLESQRPVPRPLTASWLLCAVILGNLLVPWVLS